MELRKIKLNKLSDDSLAQRQLQGIKGGCGCCYADMGGSSTHNNLSANSRSSYFSTGCDNTWTPIRK